jgi:hypothetical protein
VTREEAVELSGEEELLFADGLDEALIGVAAASPGRSTAAVYSITKAVEILQRQGMSHEEADEYLSFNTIGAWVGERTPIFVMMP